MQSESPGHSEQINTSDAIAILFSAALVLTFLYFMEVGVPLLQQRITLHREVLDNTAIFPYPYRVLVPLVMEGPVRLLSRLTSYNVAFVASYLVYDLLAIFFILVTLFAFLRRWFTDNQSLIGALSVATTMPMALRDHDFQPWSFLEVGLFTLALILMLRRRYWLLGLVTLIAAFNRETGVFIPMAFAFTQIDPAAVLKKEKPFPLRTILLAGLYFALWLGPFVGLRLARGIADRPYSLQLLWHKNTVPGHMLQTFISGSLFLGFFWVFAVKGFRHTPVFVRRASLIIPFYLVLFVVYGAWYEVRLLMMLYPLIVAMGLSFLYHRARPVEAG